MDGVDGSWVVWGGVDGGWVVWCRVDWSWVWDGCWVDGSWVRCWLVSRAWVGNTLILNISHIATIAHSVSMVGHNLGAAIGKSNPVGASHSATIGSLVLAKVGTGVLIEDTVLISVWLWGLGIAMGGCVNGCWVNGGWVVGCRCVGCRQEWAGSIGCG